MTKEKKDRMPFVFQFFLLAMGLFLVYFIYATFFDGTVFNRPTVIENNLTLQTDKPEYRVGEVAYVHMTFCKKREIAGTISWSLVDGILLSYPPRSTNTGIGCKNTLVEVGVIPSVVAFGGVGHFEGYISYVVNIFSTVTIPLKTNDFKVIK